MNSASDAVVVEGSLVWQPWYLLANVAGWILAAFLVLVRPADDALDAIGVMLMLAVVIGSWRVTRERTTGPERKPHPQVTVGHVQAIMILLGGGFLLMLLSIGAIELLATLGERSAPPGSMPFDYTLVPAVDGFVRLCRWLVLPGVVGSALCEWRRVRRS